MPRTPLSPPSDDALLTLFLSHFGLPRHLPPRQLLRRIALAFSKLPYENLTKIIKKSHLGSFEQSRRWPNEVIGDHMRAGSGGTCFSLTATLLYLLRSLGWQAQPLLADRHYGENTHCAVVVWLQDEPHLLDPGYLIVTPVPFKDSTTPSHIQTGFNELRLSAASAQGRRRLYTVQKGDLSHRLTFKTEPADADEFLKAWDSSFDWEMMQYPLLTRIRGQEQVYLRGNQLQIRNPESVQRQEIAPELLVERIASEFDLDASLAAQALSLLKVER